MIEVLRLLNEIEQHSTRSSFTYYIRHLYPNEPLYQFGHGYADSPLLQRDWIWIAFSLKDDSPLAILIAAPMQSIAYLMRIYATKEAYPSTLVGLLRKSLADIYGRGYTRYAVPLEPGREKEDKLIRLVLKSGGSKVGSCTIYEGPTDVSRW